MTGRSIDALPHTVNRTGKVLEVPSQTAPGKIQLDEGGIATLWRRVVKEGGLIERLCVGARLSCSVRERIAPQRHVVTKILSMDVL